MFSIQEWFQDDLRDPYCDPENPVILKFEDISAAAYRIKDGIIMTPCDASHMNADLDLDMYFKKDYMQFTGSFKERGARYTLRQGQSQGIEKLAWLLC